MSFDDFPVIYFALGYSLAGVMLWVLWKQNLPKQKMLFLILGAVLLVLMRLPIVVFNQEINPDESQMIAHALTLWQEPTYWQSVDGTTIGPLDIYILWLPKLFGLPFDYISMRLVGLGCVLGSLYFFYRSLQNFFGEATAQLGVFFPLLLLAFTQNGDFVHYSSEQVPLLLLNIALWLFSSLQLTSTSRLFWLGLVLGMIPFAKLQAVPLAAVIGLWALMSSWRQPHFWAKASFLTGGSLLFPLLVVVWAWAEGVLDDFWQFYIRGNLIYAGGSSLWQATLRIPTFFAKHPDFLRFLGSVALGVVAAFWGRSKSRQKPNTFLAFFTLLWLLAALYAATKSGNDFGHYLNFCIYPFALLGAFLFHQFNRSFIGLAALVGLSCWGGLFTYHVLQRRPLNQYVSTTDHSLPQSAVTQLIKQHAQAGQRLVVWGWRCKYHVETQMPQGAAETHFERCIYTHPMREMYYRRFLDDLHHHRPEVFVDAVGPNSLWLNDRPTQGYEAFAELREIIKNQYTFVGEVEHTRVFVRK
ncbi:MAG: hypothetical protein ACK4GN_03410 [Runella sp.]